jgi:hypothetical protein
VKLKEKFRKYTFVRYDCISHLHSHYFPHNEWLIGYTTLVAEKAALNST